MKSELPSGTVTFLFTDIEGSTELWEKHPETMKSVLARHDELLRNAVAANGGHVVKTTGDGIHAVFATALDAIQTGIEIQQNSKRLRTAELALPIRVGLHTGEAELREGDYYGQALNRAARIMSSGHGRQFLVSEVTAQVVREHLPADVELRDLGTHQLRGLTKAERIYQVMSPGLQQEFPALKSVSTATDNLPEQLTSFIGREAELAEAGEKLDSSRLLTLIGPGGIGKSRLALQVAAEARPRFKDGVWLVELAPLTDPSFVLPEIASVFDVRETIGTRLKDLLLDYLRARQILLILDNCEHLVEETARLAAELLHSCPGLKIIASSREALGVDGETVYRVPSLSVPAERAESLMDYAGTRLFVERAIRAEPRFHPGPEHVEAIAQICRRLDGIPLAIELAAARVKVFSPAQIATRLDDRFKLLTGGSRTALPRQQTLQALIDWSYQTLTETEQQALRRLAVFSGGWTFEAAEALLGQAEAMEAIPGLVNKSMVIVDEADGTTRYGFLETIRQYAMEKLVEAEEARATRDRHLRYVEEFLRQLGISGFTIDRIDGPDLLDALQNEHENMRAALEWAAAHHPARAARLVIQLAGFWTARDFNKQASDWCEVVLQRISDVPSLEVERSLIHSIAGWTRTTMGEHKAARLHAEQALAIAKQAGHPAATARAGSTLALCCTFLGDFETARRVSAEAEQVARRHDFKIELLYVLTVRAQVAYYADHDLDTGRAYMDESRALGEDIGRDWFSSMSAFGLARTAAALGDLERARAGFKESADVARAMGNKRIVYSSESELAHVLREHGHVDEPLAIYRDLLPKWRDLGHRPAIAHELECIAYLLVRKEQPERAAALLGAAQALRAAIDSARTPMEETEYERELASLRTGMRPDSYAENWDKGMAMTMDEAIRLASADNLHD